MIVGYCRLSRDDNKQNFSSIEEQQKIISNYAIEQGWIIDKYYIDDNISGYKVDEDDDTLFDRPAFREMWESVKEGKIKAILVKDLSRLGRNNPVVLLLIERLRKYNCKLILCDEKRDIVTYQDDTLPIKTWYNEMYVKDISKKIRMSMYNKLKEGRLIMGKYYGYIKQGKTKLIVDEEIRPCIELIYKMYIDGNGYTKIANYLNDNTSYPTPSEYYARKKAEQGETYGHKVTDRWEAYHVQNILDNDIYTGVLRTHKKQVRSIRGYVQKLPEEQHFVFENHHEAIISKADFNLVQQIKQKRDTNNYKGSAKNDYIFKGFTICGECGYHVAGFMLKRKIKVPAYNCSQFTRYGKKACSNKEIKEADLLNHFKAFLIDTKKAYEDYLSNLNVNQKHKDNTNLKNRLEKELINAENELKVLLEQKIKDIMSQPTEYRDIVSNTYQELESDKKKRILELQDRIKQLQENDIKKIEEKIKTALDIIEQLIQSERPERKLLETILDKIIFNPDRTITFKLKVNIDDIYSMN